MYIPMRQKVTVHKPGIEDFWGNQTPGQSFNLKCRADERVQVVNNQLGEEVTVSVELMFKQLPNIRYDDEVEYTNEIGDTIKRAPQLIAPVRGLNSVPVYTSVYL